MAKSQVADRKVVPRLIGQSDLVQVIIAVNIKEDGVWAGRRGRYQEKCCLDCWREPIFMETALGAAQGPNINEKGLLSRDKPPSRKSGRRQGNQTLSSMKMWCHRAGDASYR